jgi:hypothetical protein
MTLPGRAKTLEATASSNVLYDAISTRTDAARGRRGEEEVAAGPADRSHPQRNAVEGTGVITPLSSASRSSVSNLNPAVGQ